MEQNVKQVIETTKEVKTDVKTQSDQGEQTRYFGSLFGEKLSNQENNKKPKKSSRFDFIEGLKGGNRAWI